MTRDQGPQQPGGGPPRCARGRGQGDRRHRTARPGRDGRRDCGVLGLGSPSLVQAGTGTGKSLGYLAPALLWLVRHPNKRIVVATATLALQSQLATMTFRPRLMQSSPSQAVDHGTRSSRVVPTTLCLLRLRDGTAQDQRRFSRRSDRDHQILAAEYAESALGAEVLALRGGLRSRRHTVAWPTAMTRLPIPNELGPRSRSRSGSAWVRSAARTVMSASSRAHDAARAADLVVNHALLAINAMHGAPLFLNTVP